MSNKTRPARYKLAVVTWAGAYAVITLILWLLGPSMASWPLPVRTLAISVLMVIALTWFVIPALTRVFRPWLGGVARAPQHERIVSFRRHLPSP